MKCEDFTFMCVWYSSENKLQNVQKELQATEAQLRGVSEQLSQALESKGDAESKNFSLLMQVEDWRQKLKSEREEHVKDLSR